MTVIRAYIASQPQFLPLTGLTRAIADLALELKRRLTDPYRPELHYMRGPGPKWRERHPNG
ncbi:MAG TPA: hypothetical protein VJL90_07110 [Pseudorhodoplanes sp.]|nr:hypothetical protein [Pseudorhodoplanes sp.]